MDTNEELARAEIELRAELAHKDPNPLRVAQLSDILGPRAMDVVFEVARAKGLA